MMCFCSSSLIGLTSYQLFYVKREDDMCKGSDKKALYQYNKDLKCTFVECYPGYTLYEDKCTLDLSGQPCQPDANVDVQANYMTNVLGKCIIDTCKTGHVLSEEKDACIEDLSGQICEPEGEKDPNGFYRTNVQGECILDDCEIDYTLVSGNCVIQDDED